MVREIKFAELKQLLLSIGFVVMPIFGRQKVHQYPSSGTLVVLPGYEQQAYIRTIHLVLVRYKNLATMLNRQTRLLDCTCT